MLAWAVSVYAVGVVAIDLYLIAHRSRLGIALGPSYRVQAALAALLTLLAFVLARSCASGRLGGEGMRFAARLAKLTALFYAVLAFLSPFVPDGAGRWYDLFAIAAVCGWIAWWEAVRAPARPGLRSPSGGPSTSR